MKKLHSVSYLFLGLLGLAVFVVIRITGRIFLRNDIGATHTYNITYATNGTYPSSNIRNVSNLRLKNSTTTTTTIYPISLPAVSFSGHLDVECSRDYYCPPSRCTAPQNLSAQYTLDTLQDGLFGDINRRRTPIISKIQFWGDSLTAQMECDFRQWQHDYVVQQQQQKKHRNTTTKKKNNNNLSIERIQSTYVQVGCPWHDCTPKAGWGTALTDMANQADVIVFNIGAHYEFLNATQIEADIFRYEPYLRAFLEAPKKPLAIVRSPSPTNFDTPTGLATIEMIHSLQKLKKEQNLTRDDICAPLLTAKMPPIVQHQDVLLRGMADRIGAYYHDVYTISLHHWKDRRAGVSDCKHYCQSCGIWRAWNVGVAEQILKHFESDGSGGGGVITKEAENH